MIYSSEDNIVEIKPSLEKDVQFYKLQLNEITTCYEKIHKQEIIKHCHLTTTKTPHGFQYHLETFDRSIRNNKLSLSEKDLLHHIESIVDDIKLEIDKNENFIKISNFNAIESKAKQKINYLSKIYLGQKATKLFNDLEFFFRNETIVAKDLQRFDKYGLLLIKFLGYYKFGMSQKHKLRYTNFLKNTFLEVNETIKMTRLNRTIQEVELNLIGEINLENFNKKMFEKQMNFENILFDETLDQPKLNKYEGTFIFNTDTGKLKNADMNILFSFGKNYSKEMHYQIETIDHTEV